MAVTHEFVAALLRLAWSALEQERYLAGLGTSPSVDELVLEFSDAFEVERFELGRAEAAARALDDYLKTLSDSNRDDLWVRRALHDAPEWKRVRELASDVLTQLAREGEV
jgi:hypothetical protein